MKLDHHLAKRPLSGHKEPECGDIGLLRGFEPDGIRSYFELGEYPGLLKGDAKTAAMQLIHQFGKEEDDAACIVLRYRRGAGSPK